MSTLPDGWTTRRPTLADVPAILELARASDMAAAGESDFTADEVREALTGIDPDRDAWLALDPSGATVGWAFPADDLVEVYVWPGRGEPAQRHLLTLLLTRATGKARHPIEVRAAAHPTETAYIAALTGAGFTFEKQNARMRMPLDGVPPSAPPPPPGVTIRTVDPADDHDLRTFHGVIAEAFADSGGAPDYDEWRRQVAGEESVSYDEWFVAEADGVVAGVLQSSDMLAVDGEGWVRRLAVVRAYRKRGLGSALLRTALSAYAAKGRTLAGLGVDLENPTRAARIYTAAGMTPLYTTNVYRATVG